MAQSGKSFAIQTAIYLVIALVVFLAFSIYRRLKLTKRFFAPKRHSTDPAEHKPPALGDGWGEWVGQVLRTGEAEIIKAAGVDAAMYIKILRMGFELFLLVGFLSLAIILPINLVNDEVDNLMAQDTTTTTDNSTSSYSFSDLDKLSLSNVPDKSNWLYAHAGVAWLVTLAILWQLWRYNHVALRLRIYALLNAPRAAESHTVLVTDIPGVDFGTQAQRLDKTPLRFLPPGIKRRIKGGGAAAEVPSAKQGPSGGKAEVELAGGKDKPLVVSTPSKFGSGQAAKLRNHWADAASKLAGGESVHDVVTSEFQKVYGPEVSQVQVVYDTTALDPKVAEYSKMRGALTDLVDDLISRKRRGKKIKEPMTTVLGVRYGDWGKEKYGMKKKVPTLEWYRDRLTELWRLIGEEQGKAREQSWPSAFVTFHSRKTQVLASDALMCEDLSAWLAQPAPRPDEVFWANLGWRAWERSLRKVSLWTSFTLLVIFFMIPVGAVQALLSLNSVVSFVDSIPIAGTFLTGILPSLALTIFLILVPTIIRAMNIKQGMISETQIDLGVVSRFFAFQVVTTFFGSFIAGSFANQIQQFIDDPGSIITVLGTAAPQTATFFMSYIQLQALVTQPIKLLRIVPLVLYWVFTKLASTERAKARLWQDQKMTYGTLLPGDTIMLLLGVVFCIIQPLITVFACLYFAVAYLVWKYQMLYVYGQPYQTGGQLWTRAFDQAMTGTFIFQLMMIFILAIKKKIGPTIISIPLPFLSILYWRAVHSRFWRPQEGLSLMSAAEIDAKEVAQPATGKSDAEVAELYLSPSFKLSEAEHQELLAEAERGIRIVKGEGGSGDLEEAAAAASEQDEEGAGPAAPAEQAQRVQVQRVEMAAASSKEAAVPAVPSKEAATGAAGPKEE